MRLAVLGDHLLKGETLLRLMTHDTIIAAGWVQTWRTVRVRWCGVMVTCSWEEQPPDEQQHCTVKL